jgi:hypothetical protein
MPALLCQPLSKFAGGRCLACALQPQQHNDTWPLVRRAKASFGVAEEGHHLVADDLQNLLRGREAAKNILPHRAIADPIDERFDDLEIDVGFEQRQTDLAGRPRRFLPSAAPRHEAS